tara:strand:- start:617 stop:1288 length:672 start_codon:yes stop_codon:yes gene_type:complete
MVRNREKFEQAIDLRKRGFTLEEISKYCEVSKSTASNWLKNKAFSHTVTKQNKRRAGIENAERLCLIAKARGTERAKRYKDAAESAKVEFANYQDNPVFMSALTLYCAAGETADDNTIRLSHTSPEMHRLFIHFSKQFLGVAPLKVHLWLQLYQGASEEKAMKKWSKTTTVPLHQFYKNQFVNTSQKTPLHFGVGNTIIASTYHKQKLKTWVGLAQKKWSTIK